ncbi:MAG: primase-like DNA-binding domain-containing protein [Caldilineaceae bacterium]
MSLRAFKHKTHFSYRPQYKIWLSSNQPINADPDDDAVWGRIRVIEFPNSHLGKEDKSLKTSMRAPENLEGVLAWAIKGAIKWHELGKSGLPELESSAKAKNVQRSELDSVQAWLDECCTVWKLDEKFKPETHRSSNGDLYPSYRLWCEKNGIEPKKQKALTQALAKKGFERYREKKDRGIEGFTID